MAPSSSSQARAKADGANRRALARQRFITCQRVDRVAIATIAVGIALYVLPSLGAWLESVGGGLRWGFWFTFGGTALHLYSAPSAAKAAMNWKRIEGKS